ncbi:MAG: ABC transporter ATP-binding protein [Anaerolineae bacterium]
MLRIEELSVHYGHVQAVRQVSLEVHAGEIVCLLGANGAGKSSLMAAVAGLHPPSEGRVSWNNQQLDGLPAHRVAACGVALVPEGRQILNTLTVQENLLLGGYRFHAHSMWDLLGPASRLFRQPACRARLDNAYRLFPRLEERRRQKAGSLSGGEQQMLAIGRALMASPELLLLDEPSIGLAPNLVREILQLLTRLRAEGLTILLVEQDAHAALRVADRGYVLETGRIAMEGTARELLHAPRMRQAYLGLA